MKRVLRLFEFFLVVFCTLPIAIMPYRASLKVGEVLGMALYIFWGSRRKIAVRNLSEAVARGALVLQSSPEAVIKQNFRNLGKSFVEVVKVYYGLGDHIVESVEIRGSENFMRAHEKGAGVIIITGHCGNWELNALALSAKLTRINVVAREVDNSYLNRVVERTRKKYGNSVIYKKGALKKILLALKNNEVVGILMDQSVLSSEGVMADFLGKKDYTMKTPAIIARKTGSPVVPLFIRRKKDGHVIEIGEAVAPDGSEDGDQAVFNDTVRFSGTIEEYIRKNPAEWLWIHRRWKRLAEQGIAEFALAGNEK
jgi:Kdo2-lipid IVA lauroyltransferase/acyltransferase